jgi:hypothetical protein
MLNSVNCVPMKLDPLGKFQTNIYTATDIDLSEGVQTRSTVHPNSGRASLPALRRAPPERCGGRPLVNFLERSFDPSIHPSLVDDVLWSKPVVPIREKDKRKKDKRKKDKKIGDVLDLKAQTSISSLVDQHKLK